MSRKELRELIESLAKKGGLEILLELKSGRKRWTPLFNVVKERKSTSNRISELVKLGLVRETLVHDPDSTVSKKYYELTEFGKKILEKIEEIDELVEEEKKKRLPEEPEEFIGEVLKEE